MQYCWYFSEEEETGKGCVYVNDLGILEQDLELSATLKS